MQKAVIYARFSSENQHEASIDDQVRNAKRLINEKGWQLVQTYSDRAISGTTTIRPGYQALLADARRASFEVIVAEGLDRLSRDQEAVAGLFKQMQFHGIALFTQAEGEISELHVGLKGTMNALFLKDLGLKTHRGLEGRVRDGKSAGGRAYGYDVVKQRDAEGDLMRGLRRINGSEAAIVRRIFEAFRSSRSPRAIARELNAEGIPGPNGGKWRDTTIRGHAARRTGILRNDLYVGRLVWNKQRYDRNPETGKRVARLNPTARWIVEDVPSLRVVDEALWMDVQARLDQVRCSERSTKIRKTEFWKHRRPRHLFTGLMYCASCGGSMAAIGSDYVACAAARSGAGCTQKTGIKRSRVEEVVLSGLKDQLMAPDLVEEFIRAFHPELNHSRHERELENQIKTNALRAISAKLEGLYDAVAGGLRTPGLQGKLFQLEGEKATLETILAGDRPAAPRLHRGLALIYKEIVADLHAALSEPDARNEAAEILRGLVERINVRASRQEQQIELIGDIVQLIAISGTEVPSSFESSVKVVAGTGFEPVTFRL